MSNNSDSNDSNDCHSVCVVNGCKSVGMFHVTLFAVHDYNNNIGSTNENTVTA